MSHAHTARSEWKDFKALAPDVDNLVRSLGMAAGQFGLDKQLLELVKLRASQINGCVSHPGSGVPWYLRRQAQSRGGLARGADLLKPRARGTGLDRGADPGGAGCQR
jgi:hypothetical protein